MGRRASWREAVDAGLEELGWQRPSQVQVQMQMQMQMQMQREEVRYMGKHADSKPADSKTGGSKDGGKHEKDK
jgi:hypothetical protein